MKTGVLEAPFTLKIKEMKTPELSAKAALIKTKAMGICASDIALYEGRYEDACRYPIVPGHEWVGEVVEISDKSNDINEGDLVVGECSLWCGKCKYCSLDRNLCTEGKKFGITVDGACRELFTICLKYLHKIPSDFSYEEVFVLAEPLAVALHALSKLNVKDKEGITIFGSGTIGLLVLYLLKNIYGCRSVIAVDLYEEKLKVAEKLGADIQFETSSLARNSMDLVIISTGSGDALNSALKVASNLCDILLIGHVAPFRIDNHYITTKSLRVIGSLGGTGHFDEAIEIIHKNPPLFRSLITNLYRFEKIDKVFSKLSKYKRTTIKNIIVFR